MRDELQVADRDAFGAELLRFRQTEGYRGQREMVGWLFHSCTCDLTSILNSRQRSVILLSCSPPKPLCLPCGELREQYSSCLADSSASGRRKKKKKDVKLFLPNTSIPLIQQSKQQHACINPLLRVGHVFSQPARQAACLCVRRRYQKLHLLQRRQLHRPRAVL